MPLELQTELEGKLLVVQFSGKLTKGDYARFVPRADEAIEKEKKVRVVIDLRGFEGITPAAAWEDFKFGMKHFSHIERIAIVGDKKWEQWMAILCKPFTLAKVRYFWGENQEEAGAWVKAA